MSNVTVVSAGSSRYAIYIDGELDLSEAGDSTDVTFVIGMAGMEVETVECDGEWLARVGEFPVALGGVVRADEDADDGPNQAQREAVARLFLAYDGVGEIAMEEGVATVPVRTSGIWVTASIDGDGRANLGLEQ